MLYWYQTRVTTSTILANADAYDHSAPGEHISAAATKIYR